MALCACAPESSGFNRCAPRDLDYTPARSGSRGTTVPWRRGPDARESGTHDVACRLARGCARARSPLAHAQAPAAPAPAAAAAPAIPPAELGGLVAQTCAGCHGADYAGAGSMPTLRGRPAAELQTKMTEFRANARYSRSWAGSRAGSPRPRSPPSPPISRRCVEDAPMTSSPVATPSSSAPASRSARPRSPKPRRPPPASSSSAAAGAAPPPPSS